MKREIPTFHANTHFLERLKKNGARFLIVGGVAVHYHEPTRKPGDLDILIERTPENIDKVIDAIDDPTQGVQYSNKDLTKIKMALLRDHKAQLPLKQQYNIDVLTPDPRFNFDAAWKDAPEANVGSVPVRIGKNETLQELLEGSQELKHQNDLALLKKIQNS